MTSFAEARELTRRSLAREWADVAVAAEGWDTGSAFYVLVGDRRWVEGGDRRYRAAGLAGCLVDKKTGAITRVTSSAARTVAAGAVRAD